MFVDSDDDFEDDYVEKQPNAPRVFHDREDFLETLDESSFTRRFRMCKAAFLALLAEIEDEIAPATRR